VWGEARDPRVTDWASSAQPPARTPTLRTSAPRTTNGPRFAMPRADRIVKEQMHAQSIQAWPESLRFFRALAATGSTRRGARPVKRRRRELHTDTRKSHVSQRALYPHNTQRILPPFARGLNLRRKSIWLPGRNAKPNTGSSRKRTLTPRASGPAGGTRTTHNRPPLSASSSEIYAGRASPSFHVRTSRDCPPGNRKG
jgi:hypothetical protein